MNTDIDVVNSNNNPALNAIFLLNKFKYKKIYVNDVISPFKTKINSFYLKGFFAFLYISFPLRDSSFRTVSKYFDS